ncbi:Regulatory protein leu3 [Yamadazyma tenuis]|uniref:Zn(2)-C6 fungal-type domain-containing protein n=1 Tax=Candida tenuis (strain ATCC 10573 / BCRC 21748 / CBS 615 / JCM 9827 / NBRC 10315 / NRRL Y-1498 / VKM Y-70) TaxID=590646 RepID=G3B2U1_CANTC|nr:uncharacterized protein CANTEDRAFT_103499 [Yamadazyma tenuis ATCC 10573]EGV64761.1 hypothetical protein CANTEDRAFT_103499 [Yamadazyma tenuis ATCC 10573]WEJ97552.1 Regulatory protein leu3 [Yamadazyma tenuis]
MSQELQTLNEQLSHEESQPDALFAESNHSANNKSGKPRRMACVECRQQKSRCDAHERHPSPCTRCSKKGLKCDLKSGYKRTYKRARIAQIEREFSELKKTLTTAQASELFSKIPTLSQVQELRDTDGDFSESYSSPQPQSHGAHPQGITHTTGDTNSSSIPNTPSINRNIEMYAKEPSEPSELVVVPEYILFCGEKTLDTITLQPDTIKSLYLEYVHHYHPILPVVDVMKGPEKIYKLCPALFWVIMFVSLRRIYNDPSRELLVRLSPVIKDILAEITISPITRYNPTEEDEPILNACSVYSVQAFLIYTYWPPITSSLSADTSWNTIGLALFHAIRIGLNAPVVNSSNPKTPQQLSMAHEQTKTWILCNIVSQTIATAFGFPAFVQFDSSIWSPLRTSSPIKIPKSIRFMLEIASFEDQATKTLNSNPIDPYGLIDPTERLPLLKVLLRQLDELEFKLVDELPSSESYRKFQLLSARVHLLTYYFMDSSRIALFELQKGLVRLYNAAIALINFAHLCSTRDKNFIKYLPGVYVLSIWQASCIIAKLAHSPLKQYIDLGSGKQSYQAAITLAAKASILKHDMAHRSSGIMRNMWQVLRTLDEKKLSTLTIDVRSRMAASAFFDCLYVLRDQVGMLKLNNRNDSTEPTNGEDNDDGGSNEDDEEYGYQEEALESDEERREVSQKSTPSSSNSSKARKLRSLSNTVNAESKARKIIRTIPLDPQPISANNKRSNIFKVIDNSNDSSPQVRSEPSDDRNMVARGKAEDFRSLTNSPPPLFTNNHRMAITGNTIRSQNRGFQSSQVGDYAAPVARTPVESRRTDELAHMVLNESPLQGGLENLEMDVLDINSDLLWKDVDSVMNDFGFHAN